MQLDPSRVPTELHHLIPLAEKFGIADDGLREDFVLSSSRQDLLVLKEAFRMNENAVDFWLAGTEAIGPDFSNDYVAFSALRMAADFA